MRLLIPSFAAIQMLVIRFVIIAPAAKLAKRKVVRGVAEPAAVHVHAAHASEAAAHVAIRAAKFAAL